MFSSYSYCLSDSRGHRVYVVICVKSGRWQMMRAGAVVTMLLRTRHGWKRRAER